LDELFCSQADQVAARVLRCRRGRLLLLRLDWGRLCGAGSKREGCEKNEDAAHCIWMAASIRARKLPQTVSLARRRE